MGDLSEKFVKGLETATLTVSFLNDQATASVLATLSDNFGTTVAWKLLQDIDAAVAATNKLFTGDILINNLTPINGAVGDMSTQDITFTVNSVVTVADTGAF